MLSNLYNNKYTIINQIPQSKNSRKKVAWKKHVLEHCNKIGGVYDKSTQAMTLVTGEYTVYLKDWKDYLPASWNKGGYYAVSDTEKEQFFTLAKGDLIIFGEIPDETPCNGDEYDALIDKYSDVNMTVTDFEVFINYKTNKEPWKTNHIEVIKR